MLTIDTSTIAALAQRMEARAVAVGHGCRHATTEQLAATQSLAQALAPRGATGNLIKGIKQMPESMSSAGGIGRVESTAPYSRPVAEGAKPHDILPKRTKFLRFAVGSTDVFARAVKHPGNAANLFWWRSIQEMRRTFRAIVSANVRHALRG